MVLQSLVQISGVAPKHLVRKEKLIDQKKTSSNTLALSLTACCG